jgi:HEAT repeat protein/beta-lactamase regulating signal transducer with metallopeptidase domain
MTALPAWLATYAIHSTLLLGAVAAYTGSGAGRPAARDRLWKIALVGGILTATLQLALDVRPYVGEWELPPAASWRSHAAVAAAAPVPARPRASTTSDTRGVKVAAARSAPGVARLTSASEAPIPLPPWPVLLVVAWGAGAAWGVGKLLHQYLRLHHMLIGRHEVTDLAILTTLADLRRRAGVWRMVRLTAAPGCPTPFVVGSSEICVPESLFGLLTPEERRCALAHELAHVARHDPQWQLVASLVQAVFFFQPLNRLAARHIREAAEFVADDWAADLTGSPLGLARCLVAVASWRVAGEEVGPEVTMAAAHGGSPLLQRVQRLLEPHVGARLTTGRLATLAMIVSIGLVAGAAPAVVMNGGRWSPHGGILEIEGRPSRIHRHPDPGQPLVLRYAWAIEQARARGDRDAWIAYETRSIVPPGGVYGTDSDRSGSRLASRAGGIDVRSARAGSPAPGAPDLVILLRLHVDPSGTMIVSRAVARTPQIDMDLAGRPVYWLAAAREAESVGLLSAITRRAGDVRLRERLVKIIAVHRDPVAVVRCLREILDGDNITSVRAAAAEGLAWHPSPNVVDDLVTTALTDRSKQVRAEAVEALGDAGEEHAVPALDRIIQSPDAPVDTRVEAVETLGKFPRTEVLGKLVGIVFGSYDARLQDEAVETVADLGIPEAVPALKQVALRHPDPAVRSEAVEPLARTGGRASLETLYRLALTDRDPRIQSEATERMADFRLVDAAPFLSRIVWKHPRRSIRREAVRIIGALPALVGLPLLDEIVARHPDADAREHALVAISRYPGNASTADLRAIADSHPSAAIRQQALELLVGAGDRDGP